MKASPGRLPGLIVVLTAALVGGGFGWMATHQWSPATNAIILSIVGGVLLLSNFVTKSLNDAFTEHLKTAKELESRRYASLVAYVSDRRFDVNIGYLIANVGGAFCALSATSQFVPATRQAIQPAVQLALILVTYTVSTAALPHFIRSANYWRLVDRFGQQIETLVTEQTRRRERLATMPRAVESPQVERRLT
jgi:hypothetical protein